MQFRVLGPLAVDGPDGAALSIRGSQRRLLLATLILHRNAVCASGVLVDALFGEQPPDRAVGTIQSYVSRLRSDLDTGGGRLQTEPDGYRLVVRDSEVDSERFEERVSVSLGLLPANPARAAELVAEGLTWWYGGRAFGEFADDLALQGESTRLEELRQRAAELMVEAKLALGDHHGAVAQLETFIAAWPLREGFRAQQMVALYRSGRQPEALRAFQRFRTELGNGLGLEPSGDLTDLESRMLRRDPELASAPEHAGGKPSVRLDTKEAIRPPGNLPLAVSPLLGRDVELSQLESLADDTRLITIFGPGGVGKTRLAMRWAQSSARDYANGAWLCELDAIREDALTAQAVATALDVQRRQDRSVLDSLVDVLQPRRLLIVFDNCEHLLPSVGEIIATILRDCPGVHMVATSREPIGIDGETVLPLGPLPLPAAGESDPVMAMESAAVRLFVARATAALPAFTLTRDNSEAVVEICRRLDGLPLALELAAARVRSLAPADLAEGLNERFTLLAPSPRRDPRHQTLRATVAWSYGLLGHAEKRLFDRLSVFAGSFTTDDVEQVCSSRAVASEAVNVVLASLVDKSMVVADVGRAPTRYSLLETLREFGREELDNDSDLTSIEGRHTTWAVQVSERANLGLSTAEEAIWSARLDDTFGDLRVAHRRALVNGDVDSALRLVITAREFAFRRMRYELFTWAEDAVEDPQAQNHPLMPLTMAIAGYGRFVRGDLDRALLLAQRSIELEQDLGLVPCGLHWRTMVNVYYYRGQADLAADTAQLMVEAARSSQDETRLIHALYMAAVGLASAGRAEQSHQLASEAVGLARTNANPTAIASALYAHALVNESLDAEGATSTLEEVIRHGVTARNRWIVAFAQTELVSLAGRRNDFDGALRTARTAIDTWYRAGDWANQWLTLRHVAGVLAARGNHEDAAVINAAVGVASAQLAMPIEAADLRRVGAILGTLPDDLGPSDFAAADARGAAMTAAEVIHEALAIIDRTIGPA